VLASLLCFVIPYAAFGEQNLALQVMTVNYIVID